jgi:hypothetical protein
MANCRDSVDDFMMAGGVYPKMNANPTDTAVYVPCNITCIVCAYNWTPVVATNDHNIHCPQCDFETPTGN